jgi:hypothetical protein
MDRRRQVYLSPSLPWPGSGTPDVLARFLVSWQISDPERYEARLGSEAAANGKILAALKGALKTSRLPVRVETVPAAFSTLPTLRPDSLNSRLAQEGVRVLWLQSTSLRWPTRQMAIREGRATQEWKLALARLKMTAREDLARIRASYEKRRMAYRLLETMRVGRIVARGLSKVAAIEAPARRLDPGFYDFLVHYENERARMKRRVVNLKIGVPRTSLHAGSPVSGRSKAP